MDQVQADLPPASIVAPNRQSCHLLIMAPLLILMENIMVKMKITIIELSGLNFFYKNDCHIQKMPTTAYFLLHFEVGRCQPKECQQALGWR